MKGLIKGGVEMGGDREREEGGGGGRRGKGLGIREVLDGGGGRKTDGLWR